VTDALLSDILNNCFSEAFVSGCPAIVARTSYTGEDGFEVIVENGFGEELWYKLLEVGVSEQLVPAGLGARSTLRLEASYPLYGDELTDEVNPLEADLVFAANSKADYIGSEELEKLRKRGVKRKLCGLVINARPVARKGFEIISEGKEVGRVSRGIPSPTLRKNIALAYLPVELSVPGTEVEVRIRKNVFPAVVVRKPFYLKREPVRRS
jgi:aminomethyltransferase